MQSGENGVLLSWRILFSFLHCKACWTVWVSSDAPAATVFLACLVRKCALTRTDQNKVKPWLPHCKLKDQIHHRVAADDSRLQRIQQALEKQWLLVSIMPRWHHVKAGPDCMKQPVGAWSWWHSECRLLCTRPDSHSEEFPAQLQRWFTVNKAGGFHAQRELWLWWMKT